MGSLHIQRVWCRVDVEAAQAGQDRALVQADRSRELWEDCRLTANRNATAIVGLVQQIDRRDDGCNRFLTLPIGDCIQKADKRIVCPGWKVASNKRLTHSLDWQRTMCEAPQFKIGGAWTSAKEE
jgi:hypothetical protein